MTNNLHPLVKTNLILLLLFLIFGGLYISRAFLMPLAFAAILAMLMTPLCAKLETAGLHRALASLACILLLIIIFFGLGTLLSFQIADLSENISQIEQQVTRIFTQFQQFIKETFGVSAAEQKKMVQESTSGSNRIASAITGFLSSFATILANSLLVLVYMYLFLYYRSKFSKFILMVVPDDKKEKAHHVITDSSHIAQQYLVGRGLLMLILVVIYSVGLTIVGVKNAILFSLIAALFSIIPYIGNILGVFFPLLMVLIQGGGSWMFIGVLIVFVIAQLNENYLLEPLVVGAEVNIHPFFTIVIIIVGEMLWGIAGMILAIPLLGIVRIIFSNIEPLEPYAYLIGTDRKNDKPGMKEKIKGWFS